MAFLSRRRSFLLKIIVIVGTAWFTIAFLLYSENREPINSVHIPVQQVPVNVPIQEAPNPPAALKIEKEDDIIDNRIEVKEKNEQKPPKDDNDYVGVLQQPKEKYGEMGKPVVLPSNLSADIKKIVDEGWEKNAFNQYVSDLISIKRSLPDPRDDW